MGATKPLLFADVCEALEVISSKSGKSQKKRILKLLLAAARALGDLYGVVRLLVPKRDIERRDYNLKETTLGVCLMQALMLAPDSEDGLLLRNWRLSECSSSSVGDLSLIAFEVLAKRLQLPLSQLSVKSVNSMLDHVADSSKREGKVQALQELLRNTKAREMKWIVRIILKEMRIGLAENSVLEELHPDAREMMAFCVDLKHVCLQLHNPCVRFHRQEIVVGKPVKSQNSKRMESINTLWNHMACKRVVAECKFDGDRMQLHKDGSLIWFWSRNGLEHREYNSLLGDILIRNISSDRCVLDGELVVRGRASGHFKPRTKHQNRDAARAERKGWTTYDQICFVAFDILYEDKCGSVMHLPLHQRHELLRRVVIPSPPQFICIAQSAVMCLEGRRWSVQPSSQQDLLEFYEETLQHGDEGIIVKDLDSAWVPNNRDGRWIKIKPDYSQLSNDLDLLIIGGYYGIGQNGGQITSYLLALADKPATDGRPSRFVSFCRCGKGLTDDDRRLLHSRLAAYYVRNKKGGKPPAGSGYHVANNRYECPDVWISKPDVSIVLQVCGEQRLYSTKTFASGWTCRFPRVERIRFDKSWFETFSVQEMKELMNSSASIVRSGKYDPFTEGFSAIDSRARRKRAKILPEMQLCSLTGITQTSAEFEGLTFYTCNMAKDSGKEDVRTQIKQHGGTVVMNLVPSVTHVIAERSRAAVQNGMDVVCFSWLNKCIECKELHPITPRQYLHMSASTKTKLQEVVDDFGDPWFDPTTIADLRQVIDRISFPDDKQLLDREALIELESSFSKPWVWGLFRSCNFYMHNHISHAIDPPAQAIARLSLQRVCIAAAMWGATISQQLHSGVTHVVVYLPSDAEVSSALKSSLVNMIQELSLEESTKVVNHLWLEACIVEQQLLPLDEYALRDGSEIVRTELVEASTVTHAEAEVLGHCELDAACSRTRENEDALDESVARTERQGTKRKLRAVVQCEGPVTAELRGGTKQLHGTWEVTVAH